MACDIDQSSPWDILLLLIQEDFKHSVRCLQIRVVELVSDVPTKGSELSSLLDDGVEEGASKVQLLEFGRLLAILDLLCCRFSKISLQIGLDSTRWLSCQFNTVLNDTLGEEVTRH